MGTPARFMAWTASSSGVEQNFSAAERSHVERSKAGIDAESRFVIAMLTKPDEAEKNIIVARAKALYLTVKTAGRTRLRSRIDKGVPRLARKILAGKPQTETGWLHQRRQHVQQGARESEPLIATPPPRHRPREWHQEHDRQKGLQAKRRATACRDGLLLEEEITEEVRAEARQQERREDRADVRRLAQALQVSEAKQMLQRPFQMPTTAWRDPAVPLQVFTARGILDEPCRFRADVHVVNDVKSPGERTLVTAALLGGTIAAAALLTGRPGTFITYQRNITRCRARLHVTDAFKTKHPAIATCIAKACAQPISTWLLTTARGFRSHPGGVDLIIAVICKDEAEAFDNVHDNQKVKVFTKPEFLSYVSGFVNYERSGFMST